TEPSIMAAMLAWVGSWVMVRLIPSSANRPALSPTYQGSCVLLWTTTPTVTSIGARAGAAAGGRGGAPAGGAGRRGGGGARRTAGRARRPARAPARTPACRRRARPGGGG